MGKAGSVPSGGDSKAVWKISSSEAGKALLGGRPEGGKKMDRLSIGELSEFHVAAKIHTTTKGKMWGWVLQSWVVKKEVKVSVELEGKQQEVAVNVGSVAKRFNLDRKRVKELAKSGKLLGYMEKKILVQSKLVESKNKFGNRSEMFEKSRKIALVSEKNLLEFPISISEKERFVVVLEKDYSVKKTLFQEIIGHGAFGVAWKSKEIISEKPPMVLKKPTSKVGAEEDQKNSLKLHDEIRQAVGDDTSLSLMRMRKVKSEKGERGIMSDYYNSDGKKIRKEDFWKETSKQTRLREIQGLVFTSAVMKRAGVMHGDIKPGNIFATTTEDKDLHLFLGDLGGGISIEDLKKNAVAESLHLVPTCTPGFTTKAEHKEYMEMERKIASPSDDWVKVNIKLEDQQEFKKYLKKMRQASNAIELIDYYTEELGEKIRSKKTKVKELGMKITEAKIDVAERKDKIKELDRREGHKKLKEDQKDAYEELKYLKRDRKDAHRWLKKFKIDKYKYKYTRRKREEISNRKKLKRKYKSKFPPKQFDKYCKLVAEYRKEQAEKLADLYWARDVRSTGLSIIEMVIAKKIPFEGHDWSILPAFENEIRERLLKAGCSEEVTNVLLEMIESDPKKRITMEEALERINKEGVKCKIPSRQLEDVMLEPEKSAA